MNAETNPETNPETKGQRGKRMDRRPDIARIAMRYLNGKMTYEEYSAWKERLVEPSFDPHLATRLAAEEVARSRRESQESDSAPSDPVDSSPSGSSSSPAE